MNNIHVDRHGKVYELVSLTDREREFYDACLEAYRKNVDSGDYLRFIQNPSNPLMKGSRFVTKEIAYSNLGQVVWDIWYRLCIRQGVMGRGPTCTHLDKDPAQNDEFISPYEAAERKGVTPQGIHEAIKRGDIAAYQEKNGRWKVSVRSLENYSPNPVRQAAPKKEG